MNIVYAVAGEGMGHATRSKPIIAYLSKHHEVRVFAGGKALSYLRRFFSVSWIASCHLVYRDNSVSRLLTVLLNLARAPLYAVSFLKMLGIMLFSRPDALITDFEPWSTWAALFTGVRVVSIDNEQVITNARLDIPKQHWWSFAHAWIIAKCTVPFAHAALIVSFFFPQLNTDRATYILPIIRHELVARKPRAGDHVLVYQTSSTNQRLMGVLKRFPEQRFIVYGFPAAGTEGNLVFKRFSEQEFFDDLASAKAVIANGGFSLLSEALYLRKPILSIPIKGQCEQLINAHYLAKLGYGCMASEATASVLKRFLHAVPEQREALKALPRWNPAESLRMIEQALHHVTT